MNVRDAHLRIAALAGAALLAGVKLWAGVTGDLAATIAGAGDDPWGVVALIQLYTGLAALGLIVWWHEPDRRVALIVLAGMPLVGNISVALWLAWAGLAQLARR